MDLTSSYNAPKDNSNAENEPRSLSPPKTAAVFETVAPSDEYSAIDETSTLTKFDLFNESQNVIAAPSVNEALVIAEPAAENELPFSQEAPSKNEPASQLPDDSATNNAIMRLLTVLNTNSYRTYYVIVEISQSSIS
ncbi:unnamed protein product [Orchesella dallaii]|uniref:Uncharacterized protein n=1 Tax=Orchesella dallaii TaxID=48710 RepID=A0ABP1RBV4_9HEXA